MRRFTALFTIAAIFAASLFSVIEAHASLPFALSSYHSEALNGFEVAALNSASESGIYEVVPTVYAPRYQKWKQELLATDYGRKLWNSYSDRKDFLLTIRVVGSRKFGAGTDDFKWDSSGRLIAATITLGKNLDNGFPDPVYYPVMNSLAGFGSVYAIGEGVLASTKLAHEIGHVSHTAESNGALFQKQNRLMDSYYAIFLKNGFNTRDARLVSLQKELGAQPIEIWEDREYWSEVSALKYLVERIGGNSVFCAVMSRVSENLSVHAKNYKDRFDIPMVATRPACGS